MSEPAVCFSLITQERTVCHFCMSHDADVLTGSAKETEGEGKTMGKGRAVESICRPKCLPEQTGSLSGR